MLSRQAQHAADACCLHRLSFAARSVLYNIEVYARRSGEATRALAQEMLVAARSQEDESLERRALVMELAFAGERGDAVTLREMLDQVRRNRASGDQHAVNSVRRFEALLSGWDGNFSNAAVLLDMNLQTSGIASYERSGERALDQSLLGAAYLALDNLEKARRYSRRAISGTVAPKGRQETVDTKPDRFRTRLIGALTSIALGDHVRGRRALSSAFVSSMDGRVPDIIDSAIAIFPPHLLGYARFIDAAHAHYKRHQVAALTKAERQVLAALDDGGTYATVAATLGKSAATVKMQCHSAYGKLGARDRVSALRRFREIREASR
jgi:DNA-binding CsgD family transcriptional regulator